MPRYIPRRRYHEDDDRLGCSTAYPIGDMAYHTIHGAYAALILETRREPLDELESVEVYDLRDRVSLPIWTVAQTSRFARGAEVHTVDDMEIPF